MLLKHTALIHAIGLAKIPSLVFVGPRVLRLDEEGCEIQIPLRYRTRNHLGSMYFGTLASGADLAGGLNAAVAILKRYRKGQLSFKTFHADFLKRADGHVHFVCNQGRLITDTVAKADETGERYTIPLQIHATVPSKYGDEHVARFEMGLSLKRKG